jgi:osmotically-inducible protein OsmY
MRFFLMVLVILSLVGCAGGKTHESTGEYLDDVVIANKVRATILGDSSLKFLDIDVQSFKGVIQLSGFVDTQKAVAKASELARTVKGVKTVHNDLHVK